MKPTSIILPLLSLILTFPLYAQTWTYTDCVEYAREHNISLQKQRLAEQSAGYNLDEAKGQWQPTLDFSTTHSYTNTPWGTSVRNAYGSNYGLNAGWTVWNGGIRENTINRDKIQLERSRIATGELFRSLETDILQAYFNILYARQTIEICRSAVELSKATAERARQLTEAGKMSKVDYAQLKSRWEQDKYNLTNAEGVYSSRCMELKKLLQLGLDSEVKIADADWSDSDVLQSLPPIDESYVMARNTDLAIQGLELDKEASDYDIKIARAGHAPKISLNAGVGTGYYAPGAAFGESLKQTFNEQIGISLAIPILDNNKTKVATARARLARHEAQLDIDNRETELAQLIENWYIDTRSAQSQFVAAREQLASAELTDELTNERFKLGYIDPLELLTAHNTLTEARHALLQSKFMAILGQKMIEYYRTAKVSIN